MCALLLGVRADSYHTEAILANSDDGRPWGQVRIANSEASSTKQLLQRAFQEASIDYPGLIPELTAAMALPGLHSASLRRAAAETIKSVLPEGSRAVLCDDLEPLLAGGLGGEPGLLLVSGAESCVVEVDSDGVYARVEEPPEPLGQEGSGLWLGTRVLQLAARLREGRLPDSPRLVSTLCSHFDKPTLQDVWDAVMAEAPSPASILALAERTLALAEFPHPEPACRALVVRASRRLADLIAAAQSPHDAAATWHGPTAAGSMLEEVRRQTPDLRWRKPLFSALEGALALAKAYHELSVPADEAVFEDAGPSLWKSLLAGRDSSFPVSLESRP